MKDAFLDYFFHEKQYLDELIDEFVADFPDFSDIAQMCKSDPDARKLLENSAFLFAKLNRKLDDAFPEVTQNLLSRLWANPLQPLPATFISQFHPQDTAANLPAQTPIMVDEHVVFCTTEPRHILPADISAIQLSHSVVQTELQFTLILGHQASAASLYETGLLLYLGEDPALAGLMQLYLTQYIKTVSVAKNGGKDKFRLSAEIFSLCEKDHPLQCVVDYFSIPKLRHFIRLQLVEGDISALFFDDAKTITFDVVFSRAFPTQHAPIEPTLLLNCVPAANIFKAVSKKFRFGQEKYVVSPPKNSLIYELTHIALIQINDDGEEIESDVLTLLPATEFSPQYHGENKQFYYFLIQEIDTIGEITYQLFFIDEKGLPVDENNLLYSFRCHFLCVNRTNDRLSAGVPADCHLGKKVKNNITVTGLTAPSLPQMPLLCSHQHWQLLSHLSLNINLLTAEALADLLHDLNLYQNRAKTQRHPHLLAIKDLHISGIDWIIKGVLERGTKFILTLDNQPFHSLGEMYQFGTMIAELMRYYIESTSFILVEIQDGNQNHWQIPLRRGHKSAL